MNHEVIRYVHSWTHPRAQLVFHTVPMVHIGSAGYYRQVSAIVANLNHVLVEGVPVPTKELGRYRRIARATGLVPQVDALHIPDDIPRLLVDLRAEAFRDLYRRLPLRERLRLRLQSALLSVIPKRMGVRFRQAMISLLRYPEEQRQRMIDPRNHFPFRHSAKPPLDLLIENTRNQAMQENLESYIKRNGDRAYRLDVGVLLGDAHMPYVYETLRRAGFSWALEHTLVVM